MEEALKPQLGAAVSLVPAKLDWIHVVKCLPGDLNIRRVFFTWSVTPIGTFFFCRETLAPTTTSVRPVPVTLASSNAEI